MRRGSVEVASSWVMRKEPLRDKLRREVRRRREVTWDELKVSFVRFVKVRILEGRESRLKDDGQICQQDNGCRAVLAN